MADGKRLKIDMLAQVCDEMERREHGMMDHGDNNLFSERTSTHIANANAVRWEPIFPMATDNNTGGHMFPPAMQSNTMGPFQTNQVNVPGDNNFFSGRTTSNLANLGAVRWDQPIFPGWQTGATGNNTNIHLFPPTMHNTAPAPFMTNYQANPSCSFPMANDTTHLKTPVESLLTNKKKANVCAFPPAMQTNKTNPFPGNQVNPPSCSVPVRNEATGGVKTPISHSTLAKKKKQNVQVTPPAVHQSKKTGPFLTNQVNASSCSIPVGKDESGVNTLTSPESNKSASSNKFVFIVVNPPEEISKGAKLYKCSECGFSTDQRSYLFVHMKKKHTEFTIKRKLDDASSELNNKKKSERTENVGTKKKMVSVVHTSSDLLQKGEKMYKCSACNVTSDEIHSLHRHMEKEHKDCLVDRKECVETSLWDRINSMQPGKSGDGMKGNEEDNLSTTITNDNNVSAGKLHQNNSDLSINSSHKKINQAGLTSTLKGPFESSLLSNNVNMFVPDANNDQMPLDDDDDEIGTTEYFPQNDVGSHDMSFVNKMSGAHGNQAANFTVLSDNNNTQANLPEDLNNFDSNPKIVHIIKNSWENRVNGACAYICSVCDMTNDHTGAMYKHMTRKHKGYKIVKLNSDKKLNPPLFYPKVYSPVEKGVVTIIRTSSEKRIAGELPYKCSECGMAHSQTALLYNHMKHKHKGLVIRKLSASSKKYETCPDFVEILKTPADLVLRGEKLYQCSQCGQSSNDTDSLYDHMRNVHHNCTISKQINLVGTRSQTDIAKSHAPTQQFPNRNDFQNPMQPDRIVKAVAVKTKIGIRYKCSECGIIFSSRGSLYKHSRKFHNDLKIAYRSERRPTFPEQVSVDLRGITKSVHLVGINGKNGLKFQCSRCGMKFVEEMRGIRHLKNTHKGFAIIDARGVRHLNGYVRQKSGDDVKPYNDIEIGMFLQREKEVLESGKFVQPLDIPEDENGNKYKCSLCGKPSVATNSLYRHMRRHHGDLPILKKKHAFGIRMEFIGDDGKREGNIFNNDTWKVKKDSDQNEQTENVDGKTVEVVHLPSVEVIHKYKCSKCDYTSNDHSALYKHMRIHHKNLTIIKMSDQNKEADEDSVRIIRNPVKLTRPYKCSRCYYTSHSKHFVYGHMKTVHPGYRIIKNGNVGKSKAKRKDENEGNGEVSNDTSGELCNEESKLRYKCSECDCVRRTTHSLYHHMEISHPDLTIIKKIARGNENFDNRRRDDDDGVNESNSGILDGHIESTSAGINTVHIIDNPVAEGDRFKCSLCNMTGNYADSLYSHMRNAHVDFEIIRKGFAPQSEKTVYPVAILPLSMSVSEADLENTVYAIDVPTRTYYQYECSECDRTSLSSDVLYRHMERRHKDLKIVKNIQVNNTPPKNMGACDNETGTDALVKNESVSGEVENADILGMLNISDSIKDGTVDQETNNETTNEDRQEHSDEASPDKIVRVIAYRKVKNFHYKCSECDAISTARTGLNKHMRIVHNGMRILKHLDMKRMNIMERAKENNDQSMPCLNDDSSDEEGNVPCKLPIKTPERIVHRYKCSECEYSADYPIAIHKHIERYHKDFTLLKKPVVKDKIATSGDKEIAKEGTASKESHEKFAYVIDLPDAGAHRYKCSQCDFTSAQTGTMHRHERMFDHKGFNVVRIPCIQLESNVSGTDKETVHIVNLPVEKVHSYKCSECGKTSQSTTALYKHMRSNHKGFTIIMRSNKRKQNQSSTVTDTLTKSSDDNQDPVERSKKTVEIIKMPVVKNHQYKCSQCIVTGNCPRDLYKHMQRHHPHCKIIRKSSLNKDTPASIHSSAKKKRKTKRKSSATISSDDQGDDDNDDDIDDDDNEIVKRVQKNAKAVTVDTTDVPVQKSHQYKCSLCDTTSNSTGILYRHMRRQHKDCTILKKSDRWKQTSSAAEISGKTVEVVDNSVVRSQQYKSSACENKTSDCTSSLYKHRKHNHRGCKIIQKSAKKKDTHEPVRRGRDRKTVDEKLEPSGSGEWKMDNANEDNTSNDFEEIRTTDDEQEVENNNTDSSFESDASSDPEWNWRRSKRKSTTSRNDNINTTLRRSDRQRKKNLTVQKTAEAWERDFGKKRKITEVDRGQDKAGGERNVSGPGVKRTINKISKEKTVYIVDVPFEKAHQYQCSRCDKTSDSTGTLYKHMKRHHSQCTIKKRNDNFTPSDPNEAMSGETVEVLDIPVSKFHRYKCSECDRSSYSTSPLYKHMKHSHSDHRIIMKTTMKKDSLKSINRGANDDDGNNGISDEIDNTSDVKTEQLNDLDVSLENLDDEEASVNDTDRHDEFKDNYPSSIHNSLSENGKEKVPDIEGDKSGVKRDDSKTVHIINPQAGKISHQYKCSLCDCSSNTTSVLYKHMRRVHKDYTIRMRTDRYAQSNSNEDIAGKTVEVIKIPVPKSHWFKCSRCNKISVTTSNLYDHMKRCHADCRIVKKIAKVGGEEETAVKEKTVHIVCKPVAKVHPYKCSLCNKSSRYGGSSLYQHMERDHKGYTIIKGKDQYRPNASTDAKDKKTVEILKMPVVKIHPYKCSKCCKTSQNTRPLYTHMKKYHPDCRIIPLSATKKGTPMSNCSGVIKNEEMSDSSNDDDNDNSDVDDYSEDDNTSGIRNTVSEISSYECCECMALFANVEDLDIHVLSHKVDDETGNDDNIDLGYDDGRPSVYIVDRKKARNHHLKCSECNVTSDNAPRLYYHMMTKHKEFRLIKKTANPRILEKALEAGKSVVHVIDIPVKRVPRYKCSRCDRSSDSTQVLYQHMKISHDHFRIVKFGSNDDGKDNPVKGTTDTELYAINLSTVTLRGSRRYKCSGCDYTYEGTNGIYKHMRRHHKGCKILKKADLKKGTATSINEIEENTQSRNDASVSAREDQKISEVNHDESINADAIDNNLKLNPQSGELTMKDEKDQGDDDLESEVEITTQALNISGARQKPYKCSECNEEFKSSNDIKIHVQREHERFHDEFEKFLNVQNENEENNSEEDIEDILPSKKEDSCHETNTDLVDENSIEQKRLVEDSDSDEQACSGEEGAVEACDPEINGSSMKTEHFIPTGQNKRKPGDGKLVGKHEQHPIIQPVCVSESDNLYTCSLCTYKSKGAVIGNMYKHMRRMHKGYNIKKLNGSIEMSPLSSAIASGRKKMDNETCRNADTSYSNTSGGSVSVLDLDNCENATDGYKCSQCNVTGETVSDLYQHIRTKHKNLKLIERNDVSVQITDDPIKGKCYECLACGLVGTSSKFLYMHMLRYHGSFKIIKKSDDGIEEQKTIGADVVYIIDVTSNEDGSKKYKCSQCGKVMITVFSVYHHIRKCHKGSTMMKKNGDIEKILSDWEEDVSDNDQFKTVRVIKVPGLNGTRQYKCSLCTLVHKSANRLYTHMRKNHKEYKIIKRHACIDSDLRLARDSDSDETDETQWVEILDHDVDENGTQRYKCSQCDEVSDVVTRLYIHARKEHTGFRLIKRTDLSVHIVDVPDTGNGRYKCSQCYHTYYNTGALYAHMERWHKSFRIIRKWGDKSKSRQKDRSSDIKGRTSECEKRAIEKGMTSESTKTVRAIDLIPPQGTYRYKCSECGYPSQSTGLLYKHMRRRHKGFEILKKIGGSEVAEGVTNDESSDDDCYRTVRIVDVPNNGAQRYMCSLCFKTADGTSALYKHMERNHKGYKIKKKKGSTETEKVDYRNVVVDTDKDIDTYLHFKAEIVNCEDDDDSGEHDKEDPNVAQIPTVSPRISSYECSVCMEIFTNCDELDKHVGTHDNDRETPASMKSIFDYMPETGMQNPVESDRDNDISDSNTDNDNRPPSFSGDIMI